MFQESLRGWIMQIRRIHNIAQQLLGTKNIAVIIPAQYHGLINVTRHELVDVFSVDHSVPLEIFDVLVSIKSSEYELVIALVDDVTLGMLMLKGELLRMLNDRIWITPQASTLLTLFNVMPQHLLSINWDVKMANSLFHNCSSRR